MKIREVAIFVGGLLVGAILTSALTTLAGNEDHLVISSDEALSFNHPKLGATATLYLDERVVGAPIDSAYVGLLTVPAGVAIPAHSHENELEIIYVLEGSGTITYSGTSNTVEPGTLFYVPPKTEHSFKVADDQDFKGVQIWTPGGPQVKYYDWDPVLP